jgi:hypothetical protein
VIRVQELLNSDPDGYAWGVWHDRTPKLITQIRDAHPYGPQQRDALDRLWEEISTEPMAPPQDPWEWAASGASYFGKPWQDAPFLWSESYFYRRLLDAVGYFTPGPWRGVDPFEYLKSAELRDPALETELAALDDLVSLPVGDLGQAKLLASLWGNQADLGFRIGLTTHPEAEGIVADDSAALWSALGPTADVILVADNAGRELLADLVLIDHLLAHGLAATVTVHVKPHPYYISDATTTDLVACLRRLAETASEIAARLWTAMRTGRIAVATHEFYCGPGSFHDMPADLRSTFEAASVTLVKGDLNYRRLVGDRAWPPTTPFGTVVSYFPGPVAALRTLKSDVLTGIDAAELAELDGNGQGWRTDGSHGLIQFHHQ